MDKQKIFRYIYIGIAVIACLFMWNMMQSVRSTAPEKFVYYTGESGALYIRPNATSTIPFMKLPHGAKLIFISLQYDWYKVTDGAMAGFLPADEVSETMVTTEE